MKKFGVFIIVNNAWKLHCIYNNRHDANQEIKYLTEKLGIKANLFVK